MPGISGFDINTQNQYAGYNPYNNVEEFVSEDFVNAYLNATNQATPDLWNRIEAGFAIEARDVVTERRKQSSRTKKMMGFVAAAVIITIIAIPVLKIGTKHKDEDKNSYIEKGYENSVKLDNESAYESVDEEAAMESPVYNVEGEYQEESMESAEEPSYDDNDEMNNDQFHILHNWENHETQEQLDEIEGTQIDERQLVIEGEFIFDDSDNLIFKIDAVKENQYMDIDLNVGDKITLSNPLYVQTMSVMIYKVEITLDSICIDDLGNITGRIIDFTHK